MFFSVRTPVSFRVFIVVLIAFSPSCHAQDMLSSFSEDVQATWDHAMAGSSELYVPAHTWHNGRDYTAEQISHFNETPWGLGYGKGFRDEQQNWHGFYAMAFQDSHRDIQPVAGYGHTWDFIGQSTQWDIGMGYTFLVTARQDIYSYRLPIPFVLPLVSVGSGKVSIFGTYVPWIYGHGGVGFLFGKITLN